MSNFVLPAWFDPEATVGPFDFLASLKAPFTILDSGYFVVRSGGPGTESQVFGEKMPDWKRALKAKVGRGGARLGK